LLFEYQILNIIKGQLIAIELLLTLRNIKKIQLILDPPEAVNLAINRKYFQTVEFFALLAKDNVFVSIFG
jgi:hypothetical protein